MGTYYDPVWIALAMLFRIQSDREKKFHALRGGLDSGINFIDTAEIYRSETIVAEAISDRKRDEIFLASKVWSNHLKPDALVKACKRSLAKLGTSYLDLYQIHFPSSTVPIRETMNTMEDLVDKGLIRAIGISNFSYKQMLEAEESMKRHEISSTQLNYSLARRDLEKEILPHCEKERISVVAYFPLGHGKLSHSSTAFNEIISKRSGKLQPSQIALSWLFARSQAVFPIPRASNGEHVKENVLAGDVELTAEEMKTLDTNYPV